MNENKNIPQSRVMEVILPLLKKANQHYKKAGQVQARAASPGEKIESITSDGLETTNTAGANEYVVKNCTESAELYIVTKPVFEKRYEFVEAVDERWNLYDARGEVLAIEIDRTILDALNLETPFHITAPWGESQIVKLYDFFVSPSPDFCEIYRIAKKEFGETYLIKD